jgi:hypothetical protein
MKKSLLSLALVFAGCALSHADVLSYSFTGSNAAPTSASIPGLTGSAFGSGNNLVATLITSSSGSSGYTTAAGLSASGSFNAGAATPTNSFNAATTTYFTFGLTTDATTAFTITGISLGSRSTSTGPQLLSLYSSTDAFASDFTFLSSVSAINDSTWRALDFGALSLALNESSTLTFRIYGSGGAGNASATTANWRVDDVGVLLTPVPEPSATMLGLMGGGLYLITLMRQRKSA